MATADTIHIDMGYRPRPWQVQMHRSIKRFSVLVVHRRGGKTVAAIMHLIDRAIRQPSNTAARYAYLAPYLKQAKQVAWDYIVAYASKIPNTKINQSELFVEFPNGARIRLFGADNPDALRGIYLNGCVLDEVAQMPPEVWGEILRPTLADRMGWALFIGTPKGINLFSDLYYRAIQDDEWYAQSWTVNDTDCMDPAELERLRRELSDNEFRQEFLCDFSASSTDNLITIDVVEAAVKRSFSFGDYGFAPVVLGVDVARFGGDRSVIFRRQGLMSWEPRVFAGIDNMELASAVAQEIAQHKPDAVFIDAGRGEGVIDRLRQLGHAVIAVNFGGKPGNVKYANKSAEMWDTLRQWLAEDGGALPNNTALKRDLCTPRYTFSDRNGKFSLVHDDSALSPDLADALALTFAMPVAAKSAADVFKARQPRRTYDPMAALDRRNDGGYSPVYGG